MNTSANNTVDTVEAEGKCLLCAASQMHQMHPEPVAWQCVLGDMNTMDIIEFCACDMHILIIKAKYQSITWDNGTKHGDEIEIRKISYNGLPGQDPASREYETIPV